MTKKKKDDSLFEPSVSAPITKSFPQLFASKIVGVQAMGEPVGLAYAMKFIGRSNDLTDLVKEYENE